MWRMRVVHSPGHRSSAGTRRALLLEGPARQTGRHPSRCGTSAPFVDRDARDGQLVDMERPMKFVRALGVRPGLLLSRTSSSSTDTG